MTMSHRFTIPALALGFLLAASAWGQPHAMGGNVKGYDDGPGGGDPQPPEACAGVQARITVSGMTFSPSTVTIDAGQPVCWTWTGNLQHTVKADDDSFTSGAPASSNTFQHTFTTPGTYGYYCQVHGSPTGGMRGMIVVNDTTGGGGGGGGGDTGPGTIGFNPTDYTVEEAAGVVTVTVERAGGSDGKASVKYTTAPGSAKSGKDFTPRKGVLSWDSGDGSAKTIDIPIKKDNVAEPDETFSVQLSKATGAALGAHSAVVTIHETPPGCGAAVAGPTKLRALGQSAGEIRLTWDPVASAAVRIERREPGGAFREIAAVPAAADGFTDSGLPGGAVFQYRVRAEGSDVFSTVAAGAADGLTTPCDETRNLCLDNGRFEATVQWRSSAAESARDSKRVQLPEAPSSGLFASSPQEDPQILLHVLDRCDVNGHYWLDFAALTSAEFTVKVRDTQTGRTRVYFNPAGSTPASVRDLEAFATCQ
jgi:plastocyanin